MTSKPSPPAPNAQPLDLSWLAGSYGICRLEPGDAVPAWAQGRFLAVTRTEEELSIVCPLPGVPRAVRPEGPYALLRVAGAMDLALTGVMASLAGPLAAAAIPIFAISTFDTDYLLIREDDRERAQDALAAAGHRFASGATP